MAARERDKNLAWWNYPVPPKDEQWLFVDTATGLPVKPEMHNERWHRVRAWVDENEPDNAWHKTIVYRNLHHHAATKWFHEELGEPWMSSPISRRQAHNRAQPALRVRV